MERLFFTTILACSPRAFMLCLFTTMVLSNDLSTMNSKTPPEIHLHLGPELSEGPPSLPKSAIDLKTVLASDLPVKASPKLKPSKKIRLVLLSYLSRSRQGLSRVQFVALSLLFVMFLNVTQVFYQGQFKGKESLVLAAEALSQLKTGGISILGENSQDEALKSFQEAEFLLEKARREGAFLLQESSPWLKEPKAVRSYKTLMEVGEEVTRLAYHLTALREAMQNIPEEGSLTEFLKKLSTEHLHPAGEILVHVDEALGSVDVSGTEYEEKFLEYRSLLKKILPWVEAWKEIEAPLMLALGDKSVQHYAVLFQNPSEMRLGGGFIGSFAIVAMDDGRIRDMQFHNIYDYANQNMNPEDQPNPEMLAINGKLELQDANFSADFELSAKSFMKLLEDSGGPGLDGVIGLNFETTRALLALQGNAIQIPGTKDLVPLEDLDEYLGVQIKKSEARDPKEVLFTLIQDVLKSQMKNSRMRLAWVLKGIQSFQSKESLIYHKHEQVLAELQKFEWSGALPPFEDLKGDYFMPVMTSLGGTKIEAWMQTEWDYEIIRMKDGSRLHRAVLHRKNTWNASDWQNLKERLANWTGAPITRDEAWIFGEGPLVSAWRFYIPEDAKWTNLEGLYRDDLMLYYDEALDHSYYLWNETLKPGESGKITLEYLVPAPNYDENYDFYFFKQPGKTNLRLNMRMLGESGEILMSEPALNGSEWESFWGPDSNEGDQYFRTLWSKNWSLF